MTGFGSADGTVLGGRLRVEIRTVNHRYYNPQLKLVFELGGVEGQLRERLRQLLERGHVVVTARWVEPPPTDGAVAVDLARARQVVAAAHELKKKLKLKGEIDLGFVARQPDVLSTHTDGAVAAAWSEVEPIVAQAAQEVLAMRAREGRALATDLTARIGWPAPRNWPACVPISPRAERRSAGKGRSASSSVSSRRSCCAR